ncbi:MAG: hypothetical protein ABIP59_00065 [Roseateles sp.]
MAAGEWRNFLWPLLVVNDAATLTLPLQVGKMAGSLLASHLVSLLAVVLFLSFQNLLVAGLQAGATKG